MSENLTSSGISSELDFASLLRLVWGRKWAIMAFAVTFAALFAVASFIMTPTYRATTIVIPAEPTGTSIGGLDSVLGQFGGLAALAGIGGGGSVAGGVGVEETLAVLRSREFTETFITENDLMPLLYEAETLNSEDPPSRADAYKYFDREIRSVSRDTRTGLISLSIEWRDPAAAAQWANQLVARLNAEMSSRAIAHSNASVKFLEEELAETAIVDMRAAISRLIEAQVNLRMLANVTDQYAFRVIDSALPPDDDDVIRPQKLQMVVMGGAAGMLFGLVFVLLRRRGN